jgi:membrane protease subunit HflC
MTSDGKPRVGAVGLVALAVLAAALVKLSVFTVHTGEYAVVTEFGNPVRVIKPAGLRFKRPYQSVARLDNRLFILAPPLNEFLTLEKTNVVASGSILWRIDDPKKFLQTVFDRRGAESRLADILFAELGATIGQHPLTAFISTKPGEYQAEAILARSADSIRRIAQRDYGIAVVDVRLQRLDFPEWNRLSVFSRMKSERVRISMQYRSEGEEEGLKIRAAAEQEASRTLAEASRASQIQRGEGEAEAARIYADAIGKAPEFYGFLRAMDASRKVIDKETTMVLPLDSELFRLLQDSNHFSRDR